MKNHDSVNGSQPSLECNYADNYYGDQVCVLKKQ